MIINWSQLVNSCEPTIVQGAMIGVPFLSGSDQPGLFVPVAIHWAEFIGPLFA